MKKAPKRKKKTREKRMAKKKTLKEKFFSAGERKQKEKMQKSPSRLRGKAIVTKERAGRYFNPRATKREKKIFFSCFGSPSVKKQRKLTKNDVSSD